MDPFLPYSIPIQGLKIGIHRFKYTLDNAFFRQFEDSPIVEGLVEAVLELDIRSDMLLLDFQLEGYSEAECDRCTAAIHLPILTERQLVVKYGDAEGDEDDEAGHRLPGIDQALHDLVDDAAGIAAHHADEEGATGSPCTARGA